MDAPIPFFQIGQDVDFDQLLSERPSHITSDFNQSQGKLWKMSLTIFRHQAYIFDVFDAGDHGRKTTNGSFCGDCIGDLLEIALEIVEVDEILLEIIAQKVAQIVLEIQWIVCSFVSRLVVLSPDCIGDVSVEIVIMLRLQQSRCNIVIARSAVISNTISTVNASTERGLNLQYNLAYKRLISNTIWMKYFEDHWRLGHLDRICIG